MTLELEPPHLVSGDEPLDVPRRELAVLAALAGASGGVFSKTQPLDVVCGTGPDADEKVNEVCTSRLRKRLGSSGVSIAVKRGVGHVLETRT